MTSTQGVQLLGALRGRRLCGNAACQAAWCKSHYVTHTAHKEEAKEIRCRDGSESGGDCEWVPCLEIHTEVLYGYVAASTKEDILLRAVKMCNGNPEHQAIYRYKLTEPNKEGVAGVVGEWPTTLLFEPHDLMWELSTRTTALHPSNRVNRPFIGGQTSIQARLKVSEHFRQEMQLAKFTEIVEAIIVSHLGEGADYVPLATVLKNDVSDIVIAGKKANAFVSIIHGNATCSYAVTAETLFLIVTVAAKYVPVLRYTKRVLEILPTYTNVAVSAFDPCSVHKSVFREYKRIHDDAIE